jgi:hypothetical protein
MGMDKICQAPNKKPKPSTPKYPKPISLKPTGGYDPYKTWEQLSNDPVELLTRVLISEEAEKLMSDEWQDVVGVAWVIRNRMNNKYWGNWLKASISGVLGMKSRLLGPIAADPLKVPNRLFPNQEAALAAYIRAREIAESVINASPDSDPTGGALYYSDGHYDCDNNGQNCTTEIIPGTNQYRLVVIPWDRTHFYRVPGEISWCVVSVAAQDCR